MNSTYELIAATAARLPEQVALRFLPDADPSAQSFTWRYRELLEQITRFANWLHTAGIGRDDSVSIVLPNLPQFHFAYWGAQAVAIANPINPMLEAAHMGSIMQRVQATVLVTLAPGPDNALWPQIEEMARQVPSLRHILCIDPAQFTDGASPAVLPERLGNVAVSDFDRALASQPGAQLLMRRSFKASDTAAYFHTGGTTGIPKVARHTHGNEMTMAQALASALELTGGKFLCGLPLFHVNGVMVTGLLPFLIGGSVLLPTAAGYRGKGVIANFWKLVERYSINFFSGVPTVYSSLLEVPIGDADVSSLRYGICGAAPLSPELMRRFEGATGVRLLEGYGLTESTCASTMNPVHGERLVGSIGKALPGVEVKVVDLDSDGNYLGDCPDETVGQLVIRGDTVFPGYLDEVANRNLFLTDGWLKTGDLARRDGRGFFFLTGRAKDLIIRGGHNIDPAVIEEALLKHPAVLGAAAVGRPDPYAGELPVVYVELRADQTVSAAELSAHAAVHIHERAAIPKAIHIIEQIPLTAVGKPFKPALVWRETEDALVRALGPVAGIDRFCVEVGQDARHGTLARVSLLDVPATRRATLEHAVLQALGVFAVHHEIHFADSQTA